MLKIFIFGTIITILVSCKKTDKAETESNLNKISDSLLVNQTNIEQGKVKKYIPENVDSEFEIFLKYFNTDSTFQMSRIKFPIKTTELNYDNYENIEKIINLDNYEIIDLTIDPKSETKEYDKYTQKTILKNFKAIIEIRGIDNGIYFDYEFKKIEGKWYLMSWKNLST